MISLTTSHRIVGELTASCTVPSLTSLEFETLYKYALISLILAQW